MGEGTSTSPRAPRTPPYGTPCPATRPTARRSPTATYPTARSTPSTLAGEGSPESPTTMRTPTGSLGVLVRSDSFPGRSQRPWLGEGRGLAPSAPLLALIHRSAWNRYSREFISKILHTHTPIPLESPIPGAPLGPAPLELVTPMDRYAGLWKFSRREQMFVVTENQLLHIPFLAPFRGCGWGYAELRHNGVLGSSARKREAKARWPVESPIVSHSPAGRRVPYLKRRPCPDPSRNRRRRPPRRPQ